jgi:hypothetical protein
MFCLGVTFKFNNRPKYSPLVLVNNQLDAFSNVFIYFTSTCFEQPSAHHQENQLYQYIIWYISLCVGDCLVCRSGGTGIRRDRHTRQSPTHSDTYQMMY